MGREVEVVLAPGAVDDLRGARDHYGKIGQDLVGSFARSVEQVIERLRLFPRSGTPVEGFEDLRRARVRHFPYGVFYRLSDVDDVRVLRVLHDRRDRSTALRHD
ncbi:plasmid stabilisation system family protein [Kineosphaera limosa NBRC 100340]|uniref:Plasmid stabilisation system family protein n=1 Tax=Kineosphaera limosa NBRC 100340 TaxID=1184609 RepID=K6WQ11_9MICO|nr:plasmid stabilisation system family protein [Kineosphaera limosa NBRC 100340]